MYIHLGNDVVVNESSVVGIFDIENTSISPATKDFLAVAQKKNRIIYVTNDLPKSFVVCRDGEKTIVYVCQVAPSTMLKRAQVNVEEMRRIKELISCEESQ